MDELEQKWAVQERPFVSHTPIIGRLIVAIRTVWNNISTRWYVLPLLQQQNEVNRLLVNQLQEQWQMLEMLEMLEMLHSRLIAQSREQSEMIHDMAAMQLQLRQLQQQIAQLTALLEQEEK
jgi:hypothetical protein